MLVGTFLKLAVFTFLFLEFLSRVGCGVLRFFRFTPRTGLERYGVGMPVGLGLLGAAFLALACSGLYSAIPMIIVMAGMAALSRGFLRGLPVMWEVAREFRGIGRLGLWTIAAASTPVVYYLLIPSREQDAYIYHFGAPAQFLAAHRILIDLVPLTFHYALSIEMTYAIPLLLGDDRLASCLGFAVFMAAFAMFWSFHMDSGSSALGTSGENDNAGGGGEVVSAPVPPRPRKGGRAVPGGIAVRQPWKAPAWMAKLSDGDLTWVGMVLAISPSVILFFIGSAKIDIAAASIFVIAVLLWESRRWTIASVLFGFCISSKVAYAPFVAVWMLFRFHSFRVLLISGVIASLPILPWWGKTWIAMGNPFFPVAQGLAYMWNWGAQNKQAYDSYCSGLFWKDTFNWTGVLGAWLRSMRVEHLPVLVCLPALFIIRDTRMAALGLVLAQLIVLRTGHISRYYIPAIFLFSFIIARHLPRALPRGGRAIVLLIAVISMVRVWTHTGFFSWHSREAFQSRGEVLRVGNSFFWNLGQEMDRINPRRTLSVGELRNYTLPGRVVYGGALGETPTVWKAVKESSSVLDIARKFRQMGVGHLLYNYVSNEWIQKYNGDYFGWDRRMFEIYAEFCRTRLEHEWPSEGCDYVNGGFYVYRVRPAPFPRRPAVILQVPGAEAYYQEAYMWGLRNNFDLAVAFMSRVVQEQPDIMTFRCELAYFYSKKADWPSAYKWVKAPFEAGLRDMVCTSTYGLAAAATANYAEAYPVLRESMEKFVFAGNVVPITMAVVCFGQALDSSRRNDAAGVEKWLDEGEKVLVKLPFPPTKSDLADVDKRLALLRGLRGDLLAWRGECDKAGEMYREALRLSADLPGSGIWRQRAADPCGVRRPPGSAKPATLFPRL